MQISDLEFMKMISVCLVIKTNISNATNMVVFTVIADDKNVYYSLYSMKHVM